MTRRRRAYRDEGSSLVVVLLIVMVFALVASAVLSFVDTSLRTSVQLRGQASSGYAADAAGQVAVDALRNGTFGATGDCLSGSDTWPSTASGQAAVYSGQSVSVSCTPDPNNTPGGATAANASPGSAVLTLGTGTSGEDGIYVYSNGSGSVKIHGGVFSNSTVDVALGVLANTASPTYNVARGACTGSITPAGSTTCNYGATADKRGTDPGTLSPHGASYDPPAAPTGAGTISTCLAGSKYQFVTPGRFTDATVLTGLTGCSTGIVQFQPGRYYFDFTNAGSHVWTISNTYVIAGTPTIPLTSTPSASQMPTACVVPGDAAATTTSGAEFVFGGDSQVALTHQGNPGGQLTICASNSPSGPPVAVYGLKTALGGAFPVSAQSGCAVATASASRCAAISTDQSPNTTLTIQGTTYTPKAFLSVNLNNNTNQVFRWGLITRALSIGTTGSANLGNAVIDVPSTAASPVSTGLVTLAVYVCPGTGGCSSGTGTLRLRARVLLTGTSPQAVQVLSWSVVR